MPENGTSATGTERSGIFTPDSWLTFAKCLIAGHEWSGWYYEDHQKRKRCEDCGIRRKWTEPLVADGGTDRPAFVGPNVEWVDCYVCGATLEPEECEGMDISDHEEYYPKYVPVCAGDHRKAIADGGPERCRECGKELPAGYLCSDCDTVEGWP